jgi:shikimate 5-dehydrogenase
VRAAAKHDQQICEIQGRVEAPMMDNEQGECFSSLVVNATSVNVEVYYNKAVNYTLMVTFVSTFCSLHHLLYDMIFLPVES